MHAVNSVLLEFSFPFITASNAVATVPVVTPYRWFSDIGIAFLYLVPQRITGVTPPATVFMVNSAVLNGEGVRVDVTSLGYYSAGAPGVAIATFVFGAFLYAVDRVVRRYMGRESPLFVLGVSVVFYVGFSLMYGDPQMAMESGLPLFFRWALWSVCCSSHDSWLPFPPHAGRRPTGRVGHEPGRAPRHHRPVDRRRRAVAAEAAGSLPRAALRCWCDLPS